MFWCYVCCTITFDGALLDGTLCFILPSYFDGTLLDGTLGWNTIGWNTIGWNTIGWNTVFYTSIVIIFHHVLFMGTEVVHLLILHLKNKYINKYVKCMVA